MIRLIATDQNDCAGNEYELLKKDQDGNENGTAALTGPTCRHTISGRWTLTQLQNGGFPVKTSLRRLRFLLLALVFVLAFASASFPVETRTGHEFIYYNNAAHQTVVGVYVYCSNGSSSHWGVISPYSVIEPSGC